MPSVALSSSLTDTFTIPRRQRPGGMTVTANRRFRSASHRRTVFGEGEVAVHAAQGCVAGDVRVGRHPGKGVIQIGE